ncbi:hypothetical protein E5288_WYG020147 [Bos mutus]|uniref:WH1 domain-containing protein n=1 Tax=Bos mutus TaxID=72004 RepID=A0A6B0S1F5_9CETA|nr:hypothetical protein [Bos mutus]
MEKEVGMGEKRWQEEERSHAGRRYMVRVRAVVMARDDSSGGWLPVGGGGLSQVSVCRVRGARPEGGARQGHYVIHGERLRDQKITLECTLRPGLVYNKVNPIFHHWSLGDCKFGLTFQSPAEADEFQKSLLAALAALGRVPRGQRLLLQSQPPGDASQRSGGPHRHGGVSFRLRAGHAPPAPPLISSGGAPGKRGQGAGVPKWAGAEAAEGQEITDSKGWLTCLVARELRPGKLSSWEDWVRASRASPALLETGTL